MLTRHTTAAIRKIQAAYRKHRIFRDAVCPITQELIGDAPRFEFVDKDGCVHTYELTAIVGYILATGKAVDPCTRQVYNEAELKRIDRTVARFSLDYPSTHTAVTSPAEQARYIVARRFDDTFNDAIEDMTEREEHITMLLDSGAPVRAWATYIMPQYKSTILYAFVLGPTETTRRVEAFSNVLTAAGVLDLAAQVRLVLNDLRQAQFPTPQQTINSIMHEQFPALVAARSAAMELELDDSGDDDSDPAYIPTESTTIAAHEVVEIFYDSVHAHTLMLNDTVAPFLQ